MKKNEFDAGIDILKPIDLYECEFYWLVYETAAPISRNERKILKDLDWKLMRHSRTKKEMWCFIKAEHRSNKNETIKY